MQKERLFQLIRAHFGMPNARDIFFYNVDKVLSVLNWHEQLFRHHEASKNYSITPHNIGFG